MRRPTARKAPTIVLALALALTGAPRRGYSPHEKAFYAPNAVVAFVRPGLSIHINSAQIAGDGTIKVNYSITDPQGLPLDIRGVNTPGPVSLSYVAAVLPNDQTQYTAYTTRQATGAVSGTVTQAGADSGGANAAVSDGRTNIRSRPRLPRDSTQAPHTLSAFTAPAI